MSVKELSNLQLFAMVMDDKLPHDISDEVNREFKRRDFDIHQLDKLSLQYKRFSDASYNDIRLAEKIILILFPFINIFQIIIANRHLGKGETNKWKQHWKFIVIGYTLWTILIILLSDFLIRFINL